MRALRLLVVSSCLICLAEAESADRINVACKQVAMKANERVAVVPQDFDTGVCWGAFGALEQAIKAASDPKRPSPAASRICVPNNTSRPRLIAVFSEFLKRSPARAQEDFYPVALDALREAFPCRPAAASAK